MTPVRWLLLAQADLPSGESWLAAAERDRLAGLRVPKRRAEWLLGRWTAKQAVLASLPASLAAADVEIRPAPDGAPEVLVGGRPAELALSLSHRAGLALCALAPAGTALGCDIELVEPRRDAFVTDYLTAAERGLVERAGPSHKALAVTLVWSAKESALKALRAGLRLDTRDVVVVVGQEDLPPVSMPSGHWWPLAVRYPAGGQVLAGWWRWDDEWVTTVVAAPPPAPPERLCGMHRLATPFLSSEREDGGHGDSRADNRELR